MKKILVLIASVFYLCSCESDINIFKERYDDSELWLTVDNKIDKLDISFDTKTRKESVEKCIAKYEDKKILPDLGSFKDKDGKVWTLVSSGQKESGEITIVFKNKQFKTKGFDFGEKRYIEVILLPTGEIIVSNCELTKTEVKIKF